MIGSGVLSLAWAISQLGWVAGPIALIIFSMITLFTSTLLSDCYRNSDPISGKRNYNYSSAVKSNLGTIQIWICGVCQYVNLCGTAVGYTITASISVAAITKSYCFHKKGHEADCGQDKFCSPSSLTSKTSHGFLSLPPLYPRNTGKTTITGTIVGVDVTQTEKVWNVFQALGNIAFGYSFSMVLIEIQDTLKSPPAENKVMKKASIISVDNNRVLHALRLSGLFSLWQHGSREHAHWPFWLIDIANICIVIHLLGAYQVFCQPVFAVIEKTVIKKWQNIKILSSEMTLINATSFSVTLNITRLIWRTVFVVIITSLTIIMPFFIDVMGFLGAFAFCPLTVYFPIEMYISQKKIAWSSPKGIMLRILSFLCLLVSLAAAIGSIQGVVVSLCRYKPFHTMS
ncbi:hypothetical protein IEQ34_022032 [Dendrobium chrysotoxum]|uniref:Amino acid transporter transmembrane domain-containing protein n=1 Tax=Dendrobium chrysotoxum TaxID=161865 RepID=A0AAV7FXS3_DENCH|nr:hypothetical protein IEQ34_022032 [Dendrobium chrysotoxum]